MYGWIVLVAARNERHILKAHFQNIYIADNMIPNRSSHCSRIITFDDADAAADDCLIK